MPFNLDRFVAAQASVIDQVLRELQQGEKRSHWMWFVFPQIAGLGHSGMAQRYAIASLEEAQSYRADAILGPRLVECTRLVNQVQGRSLQAILGSIDAMKFHSSMTLFAAADPGTAVFNDALAKYFKGVRDHATLEKLGHLPG